MWYEFMFRGVGDDGVGELVKGVIENLIFIPSPYICI